MEGYNFLFFFFSCEWKKQREEDRWRNDSGNMMMTVHWNSELEKREKKMDISPSSFSFLVSRLARTVKSRLGIIDSTRFTSLLEHVRETWWWKSIGNIISYSRKIFLRSRLFFHFSRGIWIKNTNELFIHGSWTRSKQSLQYLSSFRIIRVIATLLSLVRVSTLLRRCNYRDYPEMVE